MKFKDNNQKKETKMDFNEMKNNLEKMANDNYETFIKALIGFEKGIEDKKLLDEVYARYMDNDGYTLLSDEIDKTINELSKDDRNVKYKNNLESNELEKEVDNTLKEIKNLKLQINERELDHYYADSFEQATQITKDIEELKEQLAKAETYLISLSGERKEKYTPEYINQKEKKSSNITEVGLNKNINNDKKIEETKKSERSI